MNDRQQGAWELMECRERPKGKPGAQRATESAEQGELTKKRWEATTLAPNGQQDHKKARDGHTAVKAGQCSKHNRATIDLQTWGFQALISAIGDAR